MAAPVSRDQELDLSVESLAFGGNGVARLNGFVVFVRRGLPGDKVRARVTRDVKVRDQVAIPAGSSVEGSVTLVERGGRLKDKARLGIRFHTIVLAMVDDEQEADLALAPFRKNPALERAILVITKHARPGRNRHLHR